VIEGVTPTAIGVTFLTTKLKPPQLGAGTPSHPPRGRITEA
jgi:hypothetical protein